MSTTQDTLQFIFQAVGIEATLRSYGQIEKAMDKLDNQMLNMSGRYGQFSLRIREASVALRDGQVSIDKSVQQYLKFQSTIEKLRQRYYAQIEAGRAANKSTAKTEYALRATTQAAEAFGAQIKRELADTIKAAGGLERYAATLNLTKKQYRELQAFMSQGARAQGDFLSSIDLAIGRLIKYRVAYGIYQKAVELASGSVKEFIQINKQLSELAIVIDPATVNLEELRKTAQSLGRQFGVTTAEVLKSFNTWARVGLEGKQLAKATEATLLGVNALGLSVSEMTDALTSVIFTYDKNVEDTIQVMSSWLRVANAFPLAGADLAKGLFAVGSAAKEVGIDLNDLSGYIAAINAVTRKSGTAIGQSLKTQLARLVKPETEQLLGDIGIPVRETADDFRDMDSVLNDLSKKWDGLSQVQRTNIAVAVGGIRRYVDFLALMDRWDIKLRAVALAQSATDEAQRANEITMSSFAKRVDQLNIAFDNLKYNLGEKFAQSLVGPMKILKAFIDIMNTTTGGVLLKTLYTLGASVASFTLLLAIGSYAVKGFARTWTDLIVPLGFSSKKIREVGFQAGATAAQLTLAGRATAWFGTQLKSLGTIAGILRWASLIGVLVTLIDLIFTFGRSTKQVTTDFSEFGDKLTKIDQLKAKISAAQAELDYATAVGDKTKIDEVTESLKQLNQELNRATEGSGNIASLEQTIQGYENLAASFDVTARKMTDQLAILRANQKQTEEYARALTIVNETIIDLERSSTGSGAALAKVRDAILAGKDVELFQSGPQSGKPAFNLEDAKKPALEKAAATKEELESQRKARIASIPTEIKNLQDQKKAYEDITSALLEATKGLRDYSAVQATQLQKGATSGEAFKGLLDRGLSVRGNTALTDQKSIDKVKAAKEQVKKILASPIAGAITEQEKNKILEGLDKIVTDYNQELFDKFGAAVVNSISQSEDPQARINLIMSAVIAGRKKVEGSVDGIIQYVGNAIGLTSAEIQQLSQELDKVSGKAPKPTEFGGYKGITVDQEKANQRLFDFQARLKQQSDELIAAWNRDPFKNIDIERLQKIAQISGASFDEVSTRIEIYTKAYGDYLQKVDEQQLKILNSDKAINNATVDLAKRNAELGRMVDDPTSGPTETAKVVAKKEVVQAKERLDAAIEASKEYRNQAAILAAQGVEWEKILTYLKAIQEYSRAYRSEMASIDNMLEMQKTTVEFLSGIYKEIGVDTGALIKMKTEQLDIEQEIKAAQIRSTKGMTADEKILAINQLDLEIWKKKVSLIEESVRNSAAYKDTVSAVQGASDVRNIFQKSFSIDWIGNADKAETIQNDIAKTQQEIINAQADGDAQSVAAAEERLRSLQKELDAVTTLGGAMKSAFANLFEGLAKEYQKRVQENFINKVLDITIGGESLDVKISKAISESAGMMVKNWKEINDQIVKEYQKAGLDQGDGLKAPLLSHADKVKEALENHVNRLEAILAKPLPKQPEFVPAVSQANTGAKLSREAVTYTSPKNTTDKIAQQFGAAIVAAANEFGVPADLGYAVIKAESSGDPTQVSEDKKTGKPIAYGLMQLRPGTAKDMGLDFKDIMDPYKNIMAGMKYLGIQIAEQGDLETALAAYNAGPDRVKKAGGIPDIKETKDYINKVLKFRAEAPDFNTPHVPPPISQKALFSLADDPRQNPNIDGPADRLPVKEIKKEFSSILSDMKAFGNAVQDAVADMIIMRTNVINEPKPQLASTNVPPPSSADVKVVPQTVQPDQKLFDKIFAGQEVANTFLGSISGGIVSLKESNKKQVGPLATKETKVIENNNKETKNVLEKQTIESKKDTKVVEKQTKETNNVLEKQLEKQRETVKTVEKQTPVPAQQPLAKTQDVVLKKEAPQSLRDEQKVAQQLGVANTLLSDISGGVLQLKEATPPKVEVQKDNIQQKTDTVVVKKESDQTQSLLSGIKKDEQVASKDPATPEAVIQTERNTSNAVTALGDIAQSTKTTAEATQLLAAQAGGGTTADKIATTRKSADASLDSDTRPGPKAEAKHKDDGADDAANAAREKLVDALKAAGQFVASSIASSITASMFKGNKAAQVGGSIGQSVGKAAGAWLGTKVLGKALGTAVGGPVGTIIGGVIGGAIGSLFGKKKRQEEPVKKAIEAQTAAIEANTNALKNLDASVLNAPTRFIVPLAQFNRGSNTGQAASMNVNVNINAQGANAREVASEVQRIIEYNYQVAVNTSGSNQRYAL